MSSPPDHELDHQEHLSDGSEASDPPTVSIVCTSCRRLVPVDAACPHCGHSTGPLVADLSADAPRALAEPADPTVVLPPVPVRTAELDLAELSAAPPAAPTVAPPVATPEGRPSATPRRALAVVGGAAALVLVGAAAVAGLRAGGGDAPGSSASRITSGADVVPVDPAGVRAAASSTQHPDGRITYAASNTLDGRPQTAWNSDGRGVGVTLTYTFPEPVDLRSVTLRNGYQKLLRTSGGATVDLYALNQRIRTFTVVTDTGRVSWDLRDDRTPQTLTHDFGRTRSVRLQVTAVYPSAKYRDLALSDVAFGAAS